MAKVVFRRLGRERNRRGAEGAEEEKEKERTSLEFGLPGKLMWWTTNGLWLRHPCLTIY
ncbi:MAG: hypothetical protein QNJ36_01880 [Calothrix sp. MO_167.B42]|nr:hypothetical protein [Calothrix sp. MO_167.B42]